MPRRTPTQQAADLRAKAAALDFKARVAESPALKMAIKLRGILPDVKRTGDLTGSEEALADLIDALDAYIGEVP